MLTGQHIQRRDHFNTMWYARIGLFVNVLFLASAGRQNSKYKARCNSSSRLSLSRPPRPPRPRSHLKFTQVSKWSAATQRLRPRALSNLCARSFRICVHASVAKLDAPNGSKGFKHGMLCMRKLGIFLIRCITTILTPFALGTLRTVCYNFGESGSKMLKVSTRLKIWCLKQLRMWQKTAEDLIY